MFGWLFKTRDSLVRLGLGQDRKAFVDALGRSDLIVLSLADKDGLDPAAMTQETFLAYIEANAREVSEQAEFPPFTYPKEGRHCFPVFSSTILVERFIGEYSKDFDRIFPFQTLTVVGSSLREQLLMAELAVLNPRTQHERALTAEDLQILAENWP